MNKLLEEHERTLRPIRKELARLEKGKQTKAAMARKNALEGRLHALSNIGRFAAGKGYDAFHIHSEWVILNRSALIIER
ncbi:hypothetical protein [Nocardia sp. NPDC050412]|uniref:hypothetical protein n=1 Tax=Nocardia sp. NPDC050412 TaxID=3364320 RepID=UPI0037A4411E